MMAHYYSRWKRQNAECWNLESSKRQSKRNEMELVELRRFFEVAGFSISPGRLSTVQVYQNAALLANHPDHNLFGPVTFAIMRHR
ncbi:hypothetical protein AND_000668 [Anopheles darlingi]|uniref:Uncharacterized protein n=1 Tax=Anopheles darlingi TaxID=43151 RepID=W5JWE0_ANODA|nr:hypothetical protein AND_000668 [Anopheles darlingi]